MAKDEPIDRGEPEAVARAGNKAKLQRQQELNDVRHVVNSAAGRRFIWCILKRAEYFGDAHVPGSFDLTARNEGKKALAKFILDEMNEANNAAFVDMWVENMKKGD